MMPFTWKRAQIQKLTGKEAKSSNYPEAMNSHPFQIRLSDPARITITPPHSGEE